MTATFADSSGKSAPCQ